MTNILNIQSVFDTQKSSAYYLLRMHVAYGEFLADCVSAADVLKA